MYLRVGSILRCSIILVVQHITATASTATRVRDLVIFSCIVSGFCMDMYLTTVIPIRLCDDQNKAPRVRVEIVVQHAHFPKTLIYF